MAIRFTTFIKHRDREVCLYVIEENNQLGMPLFRVLIKDETHTIISLWEKQGNNLELVTQHTPGWVSELKDVLKLAIEKHVAILKFS